MIIGHGQFITHANVTGREELVPIDTSPLKLSICTFAPPGESCFYPHDNLIDMKNKLVAYSTTIDNFEDSFQQSFEMAQKETLGRLYNSPEWAPFFNKRHELSESCIRSTRYFEKEFSSDEHLECGIFIIKNNVGLTNNSVIALHDTLLSDLVDYFKSLQVEHVFVVDTTCSVFLNVEKTDTITDERIIRRLRKHILTLPRIGGKRKRTKKRRMTKKRKRTNRRRNMKR